LDFHLDLPRRPSMLSVQSEYRRTRKQAGQYRFRDLRYSSSLEFWWWKGCDRLSCLIL
jgi:hypothetical protein